nr:MAG TPA: hypothetical protein [Caudoviricetes sp.]
MPLFTLLLSFAPDGATSLALFELLAFAERLHPEKFTTYTP